MNGNNDKNNNQRYILTRETLGMTILLFSVIIFIMLLTRDAVFSSIGTAICTFMYGTFGFGSFFVLMLTGYLGVWLVWEKTVKVSVKCRIGVTFFMLAFFLLFHSVTARNLSLDSYGQFVSLCYNNASLGWGGYTCGGALSAILVYPIAKLATFIGAYVIFSVLVLVAGYVAFIGVRDEINKVKIANMNNANAIKARVGERPAIRPPQPRADVADSFERAEISRPDNLYTVSENYEIVNNVPRPVQHAEERAEQPRDDGNRFSRENLGRKILFENGEFAAESYRRNMIFNDNSYINNPVHSDDDYLRSFGNSLTRPKNPQSEEQPTYTESYRQSLENNQQYAPSNYVYGDKPVEKLDDSPSVTEGVYREEQHADSDADVNPSVQDSGFGEYGDENTALRDASESDMLYDDYTGTPAPFGDDGGHIGFNSRGTDGGAPSDAFNDRSSDGYSLDRRINDDFEDGNTVIPDRRGVEEGRFGDRRDLSDSPSRDRADSLNGGDRSDGGRCDLFGSSGRNPGGTPLGSASSRMQSRSTGLQDDDLFGDDGDDVFGSPANDRSRMPLDIGRDRSQPVIDENRRETVRITPPAEPSVEPVQQPVRKHVWKKYVAPSLDLLQNYSEFGSSNASEIEDNKRAIEETFANVRIESEVVNVIVGSRFTRYDVKIKDSTSIKTALKHKDEIQIALRKDTINTYINFKLAALSIEVPNRESGIV